MDVRFLTGNVASETAMQLIAESERIEFAVAWATRNRVASSLVGHATKITRGIVGTHMYQTSPDVLRAFLGAGTVRYVLPVGRLFHPKVYVFWRGNSLTAIVGSHNLTAAAFDTGNIEASLLCSGEADEQPFVELVRFIEQSWATAATIADDESLMSYELQYEANRSSREALGAFRKVRSPRNPHETSPLRLTWHAFVEHVRNDPHHSADGRVAVLENARRLFVDRGSFEAMTLGERKAIAGTYGRKERQLNDHDWAWFGTMFGQGDFKNLVNESPGVLSRALDHIPLSGPVEESHYRGFVEYFENAFVDKAHKGGVATASRLLAMKRPDWFVAVNNANRDKLCSALNVAPTTLRLENYWESIVASITLSRWWNHERPVSGHEAHLWENRAALLDSLFYEPM